MKYLVMILLALGIAGCQKTAEQEKTIRDYRVETLFTHEGCTVYRFHDLRTVYYTNCRGTTHSEYGCGKNCTEADDTSTEVSE